jgi:hypothetical protein
MPYNLTFDKSYNRGLVHQMEQFRKRQTGYYVPSNIQPNYLYNPARDGGDERIGGSATLPTRKFLGSGIKKPCRVKRQIGGIITPIGYNQAPIIYDPRYLGQIYSSRV